MVVKVDISFFMDESFSQSVYNFINDFQLLNISVDCHMNMLWRCWHIFSKWYDFTPKYTVYGNQNLKTGSLYWAVVMSLSSSISGWDNTSITDSRSMARHSAEGDTLLLKYYTFRHCFDLSVQVNGSSYLHRCWIFLVDKSAIHCRLVASRCAVNRT